MRSRVFSFGDFFSLKIILGQGNEKSQNYTERYGEVKEDIFHGEILT